MRQRQNIIEHKMLFIDGQTAKSTSAHEIFWAAEETVSRIRSSGVILQVVE